MNYSHLSYDSNRPLGVSITGKVSVVLAGGGSRGSWESGVLDYIQEQDLFSNGPFRYDNVSVGAIIGLGIAQFKASQWREAYRWVTEMWLTKLVDTKDVWSKRFPFGIPGLWKESIGKNDALRELLNGIIDCQAVNNSDIEMRQYAVDLLSGELEVFDQHSLHLISDALASGSYPVALPPEKIDGMYLTDGGVREIAALGPAIRSGAETILVLTVSNPWEMESVTMKDLGTTQKNTIRQVDIALNEILRNDLKSCIRINDWIRKGNLINTKYRPVDLHIIYPQTPLGSPLDFSSELMAARHLQGRMDAHEYFGKIKCN